jgi:hypothetical protein
MSFRRRHLRIRKVALGLAVAAVAAPMAQGAVDRGIGVSPSKPATQAGDYGMPRAMPSDYARHNGYTPWVTDFPQPAQAPTDLTVRDYATDGRGYTPGTSPQPAQAVRDYATDGRGYTAGISPQPAQAPTDLTVRDYANDGRGYTPGTSPVLVSTPSSGGFDWSDAGAGFALAAGLALAGAGAAIASRGRGRLATGQ